MFNGNLKEIGKVYGEWTILSYIPPNERKIKTTNYLARCSCGIERPIRLYDLKNGKSSSCGHAHRKDYGFKIGDTYGELTLLRQETNIHGNHIQKYLCQCSCGNQIILPAKLINEKKNCGCKPYEGFDKLDEMIGRRFGHLTVIQMSERLDCYGKRSYRICKCDCGNIVEVSRRHLISGHTQSCGCLISNGENYVTNFLQKYNINIKRQYRISDCVDKGPLPFDIAILSNNNKILGLIEVQGKQHYQTDLLYYNNDLWKHDKIKEDYCKNNNIPFLTLDYSKGQEYTNFNEWDSILLNFLKEIGIDGIFSE